MSEFDLPKDILETAYDLAAWIVGRDPFEYEVLKIGYALMDERHKVSNSATLREQNPIDAALSEAERPVEEIEGK